MHKPPTFGEIRFSCPHCGTFAHQYWAKLRYNERAKDDVPRRFEAEGILELIEEDKKASDERKIGIKALNAALSASKGAVVISGEEPDRLNSYEVYNLDASRCDSCDKISVWLQDKLVYPAAGPAGIANSDMPDDVKLLYDEAGAVFQTSPRAAAALLRLALQHLLIALGEKGDNICEDINKLVDKGLDADTALTMDTIRIVGNESAHPGIINVNEEPGIAAAMFKLLNEIVDDMISKPLRKEAIRKKLPENKRVEIERKLAKRDRGDSK